jgi:hypothetical protein
VTCPGSLPGGLVAAWLDNWAWLPGLALFLSALIMLVPDGHLASHRLWPVPTAVAIGTVLGSLWASASAEFELADTQIANPLGSNGPVVAAAGAIGAVLVFAGPDRLARCLCRPVATPGGDERQQLRWVVVSFASPSSSP